MVASISRAPSIHDDTGSVVVVLRNQVLAVRTQISPGFSIGKDGIAFAAPALRIDIAPASANVLFLSV